MIGVIALGAAVWAISAAWLVWSCWTAPTLPPDRSGLDRLDRDHRGVRPAAELPAELEYRAAGGG